MSIGAMVKDFFNKTVDARFKHDKQGRLIFLPWGFGTGRLVPDADVELRLRQVSMRLMIASFVVFIPVISALIGIYQPKGAAFVGFLVICTAMGYAFQLYPAWIARNLPRSDERISYSAAMVNSLDRFGRKFLIFGLATSVAFTVGAALLLLFDPGQDRLALGICLAIFAPMAIVYAIALKRRSSDKSRVA